MPAPSLPEDQIRKIVELRARGQNISEIARLLSLNRTTVQKYARRYGLPGGGKDGSPASNDGSLGEAPSGRVGELVDRLDIDGTVDLLKLDRPATIEELMALCQLDRTRWVPQYFKPNSWQGFYKLKQGNSHQKVQLFQSKAVFKRILTEELEGAILKFVEEHVTPLPKPPLGDSELRVDRDGYMVCWGLWDAHLGLYAWDGEVGSDYDLSIASQRVFNSIDDICLELGQYPLDRFVLPIGNDFMHFDSVRHTTTHGTHFLDTDTRYGKVYLECLRCLSYMVERALELCDRVELLYIPGNHDVTSSFTLTVALAQRYRNDPRVSVDLRMNPRKYVIHGGTIVGFDHGRDVRPDQYSLIFGTEPGVKEHWSSSTYREVQVGDKHQRWEKMYEGVTPTNGLLVRRNPSLCNVDAWHHNQGLVGEPMKSVEAWRYDKLGYRGSHVAWARDERSEAASAHRL